MRTPEQIQSQKEYYQRQKLLRVEDYHRSQAWLFMFVGDNLPALRRVWGVGEV